MGEQYMGEPSFQDVADTETHKAHVLGQAFEGHLQDSLHMQLHILLTLNTSIICCCYKYTYICMMYIFHILYIYKEIY